ncbi:unnamed protein product [Merluccius merluccius]
MIGGCCVCSDERGWAENPLVYCDGHGCNVAVHQACYGIVQVPTGPWFCRKCESQERAARVRCELCPHKDGALKRTDNGGWAHVVCALYIPEVEFANVSTMEPIVLQSVPHERYNKTCYICEEQGRESKAATGACMTCNKHGCRQAFHVTCAQFAGLLCEEQGSDADNVKYCGYCKYHHSKLRRSRGRGSRSQSLSDSSPQCMDRASDQDKKKHKERDRHKPKHKKTPLDMSPSLVLPNTMVPDKGYNCSSGSGGGVASLPTPSQKRLDDGTARFTTANFQEVPSAHASGGGAKDGSVADSGKPGPDTKSKKSNIGGAGAVTGGGHVVGQRGGRKSLTSSGKPLPSAVVTMATSSTSATVSTGPFHQGLLLTSASKVSSAPSSSDFLGFSDSSLRPGGGTTFSSPPSFSSCLVKTGSEGSASDGSTTLFGSLMSANVASGGTLGGKLYENSHSLTPPDTVSLSGVVGFKRAQPSTSSAGPGLAGAIGDDGVKKKKKGNWRNRFGPCFTTDAKPSEPAPSLTLPVSTATSAISSSCSSSSSSSIASPSPSSSALSGRPGLGGMTGGGGAGGGAVVGAGIQKSPSLLRNGTLPGGHTGATPTGAGVFSSGDGSSSVTGLGAMGGANSELSQQQTPAPSLAPPSPFMATAPLTTTASTHCPSPSPANMELSESVQRGLQSLADPSLFDLASFTALTDVAFRSLLAAHADRGILADPALQHVERVLLKRCHAAATTFILEGVKQNADKSSISSCLEEFTFDAERIEIFFKSYQKHKEELEGVLANIGSQLPHINDVSWRLQYHMKNGHVHKVNEPFYLLSLNVEDGGPEGSAKDINFSCTVEQLQDLVGKMKDAAKSLEKATQM